MDNDCTLKCAQVSWKNSQKLRYIMDGVALRDIVQVVPQVAMQSGSEFFAWETLSREA